MEIKNMAELVKTLADVTCGTGDDRMEKLAKGIEKMEEKMPKEVVEFNRELARLMADVTHDLVGLCAKYDKDCKEVVELAAVSMTAAATDESYIDVMELEKALILFRKAIGDEE